MINTYFKNSLIILIVLIFVIFGCKKESNKKYCWDLYNLNTGIPLPNSPKICDKTEKQMNDEYGQTAFFVNSNFPKFCWKVKNNNQFYVLNDRPDLVMQKYFQNSNYTSEKVICGNICRVSWNISRFNKLTGFYSPIMQQTEFLESPVDTCSKLFIGRVIVIKDNIDSLVTKTLKSFN